ncbi:MAG: NAD-dependent epimerase/dehydratase family protein [Desulfobacca sp.]|uniref:NAD-dependent epimerase/dehydratase family protein n=1 Tax=Desulfobacca sp. TaxID=2067990 RepID=UPI0040496D64
MIITRATLEGARILITGGAGMIGSHIARLAVAQGAQVTIVDALLPLYGGNLFNLQEVADRIDFRQGDIRDPELMAEVVQGQDIIFNLAGQVSYVDSNHDPLLDLDINCRGHLTVLEACRQHNRRAKLIFASSRFVYGAINYTPVDEKHPFNCLSIYGIHKLAGEKYYRFYYDAHGMDTVSLRIANPYGPRQQMKHSKYGIVNWFIRLALEGKPLTIYGTGEQQRDYIYNEDLAEAFLCVAQAPGTAGEVYNVGSGRGTPFKEMAQLVAAAVPGTEVIQVAWPADRYFVETGDYISDLTKLTGATSWRPKTSLPEGINRTVAFYREHWQQYW